MKELNEIQVKLNAPKGNYNSFGKYSYRSCEDILAAVKPLLKETKSTLTLWDEIVLVGERYYVKATATLTNEAGETATTTAYAREEQDKKGMDASQITGTASSYARKYALNGLFAIDDVKDADALNTSKEYTQKSTNATAKAQPKNWREEIEQAQSVAELQAIHEAHKELQNSQEFKQALNDRYTLVR